MYPLLSFIYILFKSNFIKRNKCKHMILRNIEYLFWIYNSSVNTVNTLIQTQSRPKNHDINVDQDELEKQSSCRRRTGSRLVDVHYYTHLRWVVSRCLVVATSGWWRVRIDPETTASFSNRQRPTDPPLFVHFPLKLSLHLSSYLTSPFVALVFAL